ncbi:MAG: hypothetical protein QXG77_01565 [Nitrososphaerota archaeon]
MPILTRKLMEYLKNPESFKPSYRRYMKHVLKHRVNEALHELKIIKEKAPELLSEIKPFRPAEPLYSGANPDPGFTMQNADFSSSYRNRPRT